jgi:hypothetical protein
MIKVWTDVTEAGLLDCVGERGSTLLYVSDTSPERAVSVTTGGHDKKLEP